MYPTPTVNVFKGVDEKSLKDKSTIPPLKSINEVEKFVVFDPLPISKLPRNLAGAEEEKIIIVDGFFLLLFVRPFDNIILDHV